MKKAQTALKKRLLAGLAAVALQINLLPTGMMLPVRTYAAEEQIQVVDTHDTADVRYYHSEKTLVLSGLEEGQEYTLALSGGEQWQATGDENGQASFAWTPVNEGEYHFVLSNTETPDVVLCETDYTANTNRYALEMASELSAECYDTQSLAVTVLEYGQSAQIDGAVLEWSNNNENVLTVDSSAQTVYAKFPGESVVQVKLYLADTEMAQAQCAVNVSKAKPQLTIQESIQYGEKLKISGPAYLEGQTVTLWKWFGDTLEGRFVKDEQGSSAEIDTSGLTPNEYKFYLGIDGTDTYKNVRQQISFDVTEGAQSETTSFDKKSIDIVYGDQDVQEPVLTRDQDTSVKYTVTVGDSVEPGNETTFEGVSVNNDGQLTVNWKEACCDSSVRVWAVVTKEHYAPVTVFYNVNIKKADPKFGFETAVVNASYGDTDLINKIVFEDDGSKELHLTYQSSDPEKVQIDEQSGKMTVLDVADQVTISVTAAGNDFYNSRTLSFTVKAAPRTLQLAGAQAEDREYNKTPYVNIEWLDTHLDGILNEDDVELAQVTLPTQGMVENVNVGKGYSVSISLADLALEGTDAHKYCLDEQLKDTKVNIKPRGIRIDSATLEVADKKYDGTTEAKFKATPALKEDAVYKDDDVYLVVDGAPVFDEMVTDPKEAINGKENVTVTLPDFSLKGNDSSNYELVDVPKETTASIQKSADAVYGTHYQVSQNPVAKDQNERFWYKGGEPVYVQPCDGYVLWDPTTKTPMENQELLMVSGSQKNGKYEISFYVQNEETKEVLQQATILYGVDNQQPYAEVKVSGESWKEVIAGWLFNNTPESASVTLENMKFGPSGRVSVKYTVVDDPAQLEKILGMSDAALELDKLVYDHDYNDETGVIMSEKDFVSKIVFQLKSQTGTSYFTSDGMVRDLTAPVGSVTVSPALDAQHKPVDQVDWYNKGYTVKFTVQESNFVSGSAKQAAKSEWDISNYIAVKAEKDGKTYPIKGLEWTRGNEPGVFEAEYTVQEDGLYTFELTGKDIAGNDLVAATDASLHAQAGVDTKAPVFRKVMYNQSILQKCLNFIKGTDEGTLRFYFTDMGSGLNPETMQLILNQYMGTGFSNGKTEKVYYQGEDISVEKQEKGIYVVSLKINGNIRADMTFNAEDAVGNKVVADDLQGVYLVVDHTKQEELKFTAELSDTNWTNKEVVLTIKDADIISGVKKYEYQAVPQGEKVTDTGWTTEGLEIDYTAEDGATPYNIEKAVLHINTTQCMDYYVRVTTGADLQKQAYAGTVRIVLPEDAPQADASQVKLLTTNRDKEDSISWTSHVDALQVRTTADTQIKAGNSFCPVYTIVTLTDEQSGQQVFVNSVSSNEFADNLSQTCKQMVEKGQLQKTDNWKSSIQTDGGYKAEVVAVDAAGNIVDIDSRDFILDTTAPVLQFITDPAQATNHDTFFNKARAVELKVEDAYLTENELDCVQLDRQAEDNGILPEVKRSFDTESKTASFAMTYEQDGHYALQASYIDRAGNRSVPDTCEVEEFVIDRTRPVASEEYSEAANITENVRYYNSDTPIVYTITVEEHNFCMLDDGDVQLTVRRDDQPVQEGFDFSGWKQDGDVYTAVVEIHPDAEKHTTDGTYQIELTCSDAAGNTLEKSLVSAEMVMDTTAPVITAVEYDQPYYEVNGRYYTQQDTLLTVTVNDRYLEKTSNVQLTTTDITQQEEAVECPIEAKDWAVEGDVNRVQYLLACDQDDLRTLIMTIQDCAGNGVVLAEDLDLTDTPATLNKNVLTAGLVVDKTNPVLESVQYYADAECTQPASWNVYDNIYYASNTVYVKYVLREHNPENISAVALSSKPVSGDQIAELELTATAWQRDAEDPDLYSVIYAVPSYQDDLNTLSLTVKDNAQRQVQLGKDCKLHENLDAFADAKLTSHFVVDITDPIFVLEYDNNDVQNEKYFSNSRTATLTLTEHNITLEELTNPNSQYAFVMPTSNNGNLTENEWTQIGPDQYQKTVLFGSVLSDGQDENENDGKFQLRGSEELEIPQIYDFARRMREVEPESGTVAPFDFVVDGHNPLPGEKTEIAITLADDFKQEIEVDGRKVPLYSKATQARIEVFDPTHNETYSGIESVRWKIEASDLELEAEGEFEVEKGQQSLDTILPIDDTFNSNRVKLTIYARDMAGRNYSQSVWLAIDVTAPAVSVSYDNNSAENDHYFKADRTATITVTERNFDPQLVQLNTTGACSGWSKTQGSGNGDNTVWSMTVGFSVEGVHSLEVTASDLAGHKAGATSYNGTAPNNFVLDKTAPLPTLSFDNNDVRNGKYYNASRTATVSVVDVNFGGMNNIAVNGADKAFVFSGNSASVHFDADGVYSLNGTVTDLAGNVSQTISCEEFVVDKTDPELMISGVEDRSANPEPLNITLSMTDTNLDLEAISATLTGTNNGPTDISGKRAHIAGGVEYVLDTIDTDDYYRLVFTGTDLAGNSVEKVVSFSENQNGTVFEFLYPEVRDSYTNKPFRPAVMLHDVDEVTVLAVTLNGKQVPYDYSDNVVTLKDEINTDGKYTLTIDTVDAAKHNNTMDAVEFYFDSVAPVLTVEGVENGGYYFSAFNITLRMDNNRDFYSVLELDGKQLQEGDYTVQEDGSVTLNVSEFADHVLKIQLQDEAGNTSEMQEIHFVLTKNLFIRWYRTKPVFYGTIALAVVAVAWWLIMGKKKKKPAAAAQ